MTFIGSKIVQKKLRILNTLSVRSVFIFYCDLSTILPQFITIITKYNFLSKKATICLSKTSRMLIFANE